MKTLHHKRSLIFLLALSLGTIYVTRGEDQPGKPAKKSVKERPVEICTRSLETWEKIITSQHPLASKLGPVELGCPGKKTSVGEAAELFERNGNNDASIRLAKELIAASFNLQMGVDPGSAAADIAEAREFLCAAGIGSRPSGKLKRAARDLRKALSGFNKGKRSTPGCWSGSGRSGSGRSGSGRSGSGTSNSKASGSGHSGSGKSGSGRSGSGKAGPDKKGKDRR